MFEPRVEQWAGCGLDQLPRSRFFRTARERRSDVLGGNGTESEPGFAEGYSKGLTDGAALHEAASDAREQALGALVAQMAELAHLPAGSTALLLSEAARRIADAVEAELDVTAGAVGALIETLSAAIDAEHEIVAVHLNAEDAAALDGVSAVPPIIADAEVPRGCVRLRTAVGWIEDGPAVRLARFRAMLDRQAGL